MSKSNLNSADRQIIAKNEKVVKGILEQLDEVKKFKVGDYLIAFFEQGSNKKQVCNSYGAPKKYTVVHVDECGIPYMKELNMNGQPFGQIHNPLYLDSEFSYLRGNIEMLKFEIDPDFADALILEDTSNFDASVYIREKSTLHRDITTFNKNIKVNTSDAVSVAKFLDTVKVGDVIWRSNRNFWTVLEISPVPRDSLGRIRPDVSCLKIQDQKGIVQTLAVWNLMSRNLYTNKPRSYKELSSI